MKNYKLSDFYTAEEMTTLKNNVVINKDILGYKKV